MFNFLKQKPTHLAFYILFFLFFFFIDNSIAQQNWYHSFVPRGRHVNSIKILDTTRIVIAGGNEFNDSLQDMFISYNTGVTWDFSSNKIAPWFTSVAFSDSINGIAVGYTGTIYKTNNGAINWTQLTTPINRQFNKVTYVTPQIIFIAGGSKPALGIDTFQTILKSIDGGTHWNVVLDRKGYWLNSISFSDTLHGLAVGDNGTALRTLDGGITWDIITPPIIRNYNSVKFVNTTTAYIVGGNIAGDSISTILRSNNGGATWTVSKDTSGGFLTDVFFINNNVGYICGDQATFYKSINGGLTWKREIIPNTSSFQRFNSIEFKNENFGVIGGKYGDVFFYTYSKLPLAQTFGSNVTSDSAATLLANINTFGYDASYSFLFSKDSTFSTYSETYSNSVKNNFSSIVQYSLSNLETNRNYYFIVKVQTLAGTVYGDTLHFFSKKPKYTYETLAPTNITNTSATFNGNINKFSGPVILSFEYDTSSAFSKQVSAVPASINDTLLHAVSATINNLLPYKTYYCRLKVKFGSDILYGDVQSFFTGSLFDKFETLSPTNVQNQVATLNGIINKFRIPVFLSFEYGTSAAMGNVLPASNPYNNDTLTHVITTSISGLTPGLQYYYRLKGETAFGTFYGNIITFNAGINYTLFNTSPASAITNNTARLNGVINKLTAPIRLSFEYDTASTFLNSISAIPDSINDTLIHSVYANITNLVPNHIYYYRLKGVSGGITIYGSTLQFFSGYPEIPNWDFQDWITDTVTIPKNWNLAKDVFKRVPGHSGNYALKLIGQTFCLNGFVDDNAGFLGGGKLNVSSKPDSISMFLNYFIEPGDSGFLLVVLKKQTHIISNSTYPITGNSNGVYERVVKKINYDSIAVPDSIIFGFISTNFLNGPSRFFNNFITIDDIACQPGNTYFQNSGFENWFTAIIEKPLGWVNLSYIGLDTLNPDNNHMVSKVYFNAPNDYAAQISNIDWGNGLIISGELSNSNGIVEDKSGGFPVLGKHLTLNGFYKYFPSPGDTLQITIDMKKNGINIGMGNFIQYDSVPEFTLFSIPISYDNINDIPDTANISIRSSTIKPPKKGTKLIIDKLSFDGFITKVNQSKPLDGFIEDGIKVYPNPARDHIVIECITPENEECTLSLININGQTIRDLKFNGTQKYTQLETGDIIAGTYLLVLKKGAKIYNKKIIIQ